MSSNHGSGPGESPESNPQQQPLSGASFTNTFASTNGIPTQYNIGVPTEAVTRYCDLMGAIRSLRTAVNEYVAFMDGILINGSAGINEGQTTSFATALINAMNAFNVSFRRTYLDVPQGEQESYRYLQEFVLRRTFGHSSKLRGEIRMSTRQLDNVSFNIMAVFRAYDEEYEGRNVVGEEVEMLSRMYETQFGGPL